MEPSIDPADDDPIVRALQRPVETRDTEFKESQPFDTLKWRIVKTCMAMANLRDGGRIIIGVSERTGRLEAVGMHPDHESEYNQDDLYAIVNRYARPPVALTLRVVDYDGKRFIAIEIREFSRVPIFCGVGTPPESGKDQLRVGDIPGRSRDRIATSKIHDVDLVAEVIEVAAEKRAAEIIATAQRIGLRLPPADRDHFAEERRNFGDFD